MVPKKEGKYFRAKDLEKIPGFTETCSLKLDTIVDKIIDGFNDITSENVKDLYPYMSASTLLVLFYAKDLLAGELTPSLFKIKLLLLNEATMVRSNSISADTLEESKEIWQHYLYLMNSTLQEDYKKRVKNEVYVRTTNELRSLY